MSSGLGAPHRGIEARGARERLALDLFDNLWRRYRSRVPHVRAYERVLAAAGAAFVNDHIAFRTIAWQRPWSGIGLVARVFEALGYRAAGCYSFPDKHLGSIHYEHPNALFPKIFVSELHSWELGPRAQEILRRSLARQREPLEDEALAALSLPGPMGGAPSARLLGELARFFSERPWPPPQKEDVLALDKESQFAAWVLLHGREVNHFTALVNSHDRPALDGIDKTVAALKRAGVPMKEEIEGLPGSKLRQSATEAALVWVEVLEGRRRTRLRWTYAYFELAERGEVPDPDTGRRRRFEGFLGQQATALFEMTKVRERAAT